MLRKEYAKWSAKPVINALTDLQHHCRTLADFLTINKELNDFRNVVLTFIVNENNIAHTLILFGALLRVEVRIACPKEFFLNPLDIKKAREIYRNDNLLKIIHDTHAAVNGANVLYKDVWSSIGKDAQNELTLLKSRFKINNSSEQPPNN